MMGLKEKSNVLANKLSGGMKRRLNICMALIHDPEILVLDEPEAGLDPQSRVLVRDFIKSLKRDKTIIITTHNMDEADRLSDKVAIIDHGKLLSLNTPSWLKKSIGEGDIVEIILETGKIQRAEKMVNSLKKLCEQVKFSEKALIIKSKGLVGLIPGITEIITNTEDPQGLYTSNVSTSIYAVKFGIGELLWGIQEYPLEVEDKGLLEDKPVYRTEVDWPLGLAHVDPRCMARLCNVFPDNITES